MNIIPSTFNEHQINCIILGGKYNDSPDALNISVVLLNSKGSHLKIHVFENLLKNNFHSIISIENDVENTSLEEISKKFPTIKFIVPLEENKVSDGELINLAMNEVKTDFVLILRDTINIPAGFLSNNLAISLLNDETYCLVPRLLNKEKVELLNGNLAYGSFRWFPKRNPIIKIPSLINYNEYDAMSQIRKCYKDFEFKYENNIITIKI